MLQDWESSRHKERDKCWAFFWKTLDSRTSLMQMAMCSEDRSFRLYENYFMKVLMSLQGRGWFILNRCTDNTVVMADVSRPHFVNSSNTFQKYEANKKMAQYIHTIPQIFKSSVDYIQEYNHYLVRPTWGLAVVRIQQSIQILKKSLVDPQNTSRPAHIQTTQRQGILVRISDV